MPRNKSPKTIDLLTIGDCSIDLFMKVPASAKNIKNSGNKMSFTHGSKIMVESFSTSPSGNSVNVAVGTSLLGISTSVYTETGDDSNADRIKQELKNYGVDTNTLKKNTHTETALHAVIVYEGERTIFSYHGTTRYAIQDWGTPKFIYYTSIGAGFELFQHELVQYLIKNKVGLAFNPGTFQMASGVEALKNILAVTDILIVNKEEAQQLTNLPNTSDLKDLHTALNLLGGKLSVITDGKNGASAYDGKTLTTQKIYDDGKAIVDMTGAGDAFSAGFMAAILYGKDIKTALKWGVVDSAAQIKVIGSVAGMLAKEKLEKIVERL